ncbi:hypothetical protein ACH5RR_002492 [Cinchona calisaya]|uniref:Protein MNN4-like n=1 Tax=Cinchona calisaya TaxID=153742 RepID=A0ABD3B6Q5_9GENT
MVTALPQCFQPKQKTANSLTPWEIKRRNSKAMWLYMIDLEMVHKRESTELKEKHTLLEELYCTRSNLSLSSNEEVEKGGETKKRKKGLKDKIQDKMSREKEEECTNHQEDTCITIEEGNAKVENGEKTNSEELKGFLEKIKEKLPDQHKKNEEGTATPPNQ